MEISAVCGLLRIRRRRYNASNATTQGNRVDRGRTISLYPTGNSNRSWACYSISTKIMISCTNLTLMVTTDQVVAHMNSLSKPKDMVPKALGYDDYENEEFYRRSDEHVDEYQAVETADDGQNMNSSDSSDEYIF